MHSESHLTPRSLWLFASVFALLLFTEGAAADKRQSEPEGTTAEEEAAPESQPWLAAALNVAGLAQFGPEVTAEAGGQITGLLRVRPFALGYLSHSMFTPEEGRELTMGSYGLGIGARAYLKGGFEGGYLGLGLEMLSVEINEPVTLGTMTTDTSVLIPSLEGGYRWVFGHLLFGVGAQLGYALVADPTCTYSLGSCESDPREDTVYGQLVLDLGGVL